MPETLDPEDCTTDNDLDPSEREVALRTAEDEDTWHIFSENKTMNQYLIKHPAVDVTDTRRGERGKILSVEANFPLALVGFKAKPPKQNIMSNVVSSGDLRRGETDDE